VNTIICIACRLKSKRLPKKAIKPLHGKPLIVRLIERLKKTVVPSQIVLCTSHNKDDDELIDFVADTRVMAYRGSELDVMSRFIEVADACEADTIVRVTGDNPLTDPELIDNMVRKHHETKSSYTFVKDAPKGVKPEIIDVDKLKWLHKRVDGDKSEYMTYQLEKLYAKTEYESGLGYRDLRLTVDTQEDYELVSAIYDHFTGEPPLTGKILEYLNQ